MTVTLTIEQLRFYQASLDKWVLDAMKSEAIMNASSFLDPVDFKMSSNPLARLHGIAEKWMKDNPMPKLVPKELEA